MIKAGCRFSLPLALCPGLRALVVLPLLLLPNRALPQSLAPAWQHTLAGSGQGDDIAAAVAVDLDDRVYVTGTALSSRGDTDFATLRVDPQGGNRAVSLFDGLAQSNDVARAIGIDGLGGLHVAGESRGTAGGDDLFSLFYTDTNQLAAFLMHAFPFQASNSVVRARAMAVTPGGSRVMTAALDQGAGSRILVAKVSPSGSEPGWIRGLPGIGPGPDEPLAIALDDATDDVFVAGRCSDGTNDSGVVARLDGSNGSVLWIQPFETNAVPNLASALVLNANDDLVVAGLSERNAEPFFLVRGLDPEDGTPLWSSLIGRVTPDRSPSSFPALAADDVGQCVVAGWLTRDGNDDMVAALFSPSGTVAWIQAVDTGPNDRLRDVAIDPFGTVFLAGESLGQGTGTDVVLAALSETGALLGTRRHNGPGNGDDHLADLVLDSDGNPIVAATLFNGTNTDIAAIKFVPDDDPDALEETIIPAADVPKNVPDLVETCSSLLVTNTGTAAQVRISFRLIHPAAGDLSVRLDPPGALASIPLRTADGQPGTNLVVVDQVVAVGVPVAGQWDLCVTDVRTGDTGLLESWSLNVLDDGSGGDDDDDGDGDDDDDPPTTNQPTLAGRILIKKPSPLRTVSRMEGKGITIKGSIEGAEALAGQNVKVRVAVLLESSVEDITNGFDDPLYDTAVKSPRIKSNGRAKFLVRRAGIDELSESGDFQVWAFFEAGSRKSATNVTPGFTYQFIEAPF